MATNQNVERWAPIPSFEGSYEVSDLGRVRSLPRERRNKQCTYTVPGRILRASGDPYEGVGLSKPKGRPGDKYTTTRRVHQLVAEAFLPPPPGKVGKGRNDYQVNHINGDKTDNRAVNLEWVTQWENALHARATGLTEQNGEDSANSKLTARQVQAARDLRAACGYSWSLLGDTFGVSPAAVRKAVNGVTWSHI